MDFDVAELSKSIARSTGVVIATSVACKKMRPKTWQECVVVGVIAGAAQSIAALHAQVSRASRGSMNMLSVELHHDTAARETQ